MLRQLYCWEAMVSVWMFPNDWPNNGCRCQTCPQNGCGIEKTCPPIDRCYLYLSRHFSLAPCISLIISNATKYHIGLHHGQAAPMKPLVLKVLFRFLQCERQQFQFMRDSVVQPSVTIDDVFNHPGGCASTDNQLHVVLERGPTIPEMAEGFCKTNCAKKRKQILFVAKTREKV